MLSPTRAQRKLILDEVGFKPTELQEPIIYDEHQKIGVTGGIQSGKSEISVARLTSQYWLGKLYWLIGLDYEMCRQEFGYLVRNFETLGLVKHCQFPSKDQCILEIAPDIVIETKSAKYPEKIAAKAVDGIILCEAGQLQYDIYTRACERLATKDGWLFAQGTLELLEGTDWYAAKCKEFSIPDNEEGGISYELPSWANTAIYPGGEQNPKLQKLRISLGDEQFKARCGGQIPKPRGLVLPEFRTTLHTGQFHIARDEPIYLGVDEGYYPSVYCVLFIQFIGDQIYVLDEIYRQHMTTEQICLAVKQKPYYQQVTAGAIDIGTKQHHGQKPVYDIWVQETGLKLDTRRIKPIRDGVNRLRTFFIPNPITGEVPIHIDARCRGLISELGGCKSPMEGRGAWKMQMDKRGNVLSEEPDEKNCDAAKALIYMVVSRFGLGAAPKKRSLSYVDI